MSSSSGNTTDTLSDSTYSSAPSSPPDSTTELLFIASHLESLNDLFQGLKPQEILKWCLLTLPDLYQTTAFGLTGLVILDMLSKVDVSHESQAAPLIFLDTLHHFPETYDLVKRVRKHYTNTPLHIYTPEGVDSEKLFTQKYGEKLWITNETLYDYLVKVEPSQRSYKNLNVKAVLTGRRRSQGGKRGDLEIIEVDETGLVKINPLANWSFTEVQSYVHENHVPYNTLLDRGYQSVGDWHSTSPVGEGENERAGRWKGQEKTECGLHENSRFGRVMLEMESQKLPEGLASA